MSERAIETPLRCATAGSVDDGKSTLIGRLLMDSKALMTDQLAHVEQASKRRGLARTDLALLTDGLRAEREQGLTIDVAWRYFATPRRRFVLADSPGHVQYTRNMVTACSQVDALVVLLDARHFATEDFSLLEQTRRHLFVARVLRVSSLVIAINKMDAVGFRREGYTRARDAVLDYLESDAITFVPVSALAGDNIVTPSRSMPWYQGPTLLTHLEGLPSDAAREDAPARLAVQWVIRPQSEQEPDYRGYAGRLSSGTLRVGQTVRVLPSNATSRITRIETARGEADVAVASESIVVHLADDVDVSRGDCLVADDEPRSTPTQELTLDVAWVNATAAKIGTSYVLKHMTREVRAVLLGIDHHYDVTAGKALPLGEQTSPIKQNDLARVRVRVSAPLPTDAFARDRTAGSVLLIDPATAETLAAGMCLAP